MQVQFEPRASASSTGAARAGRERSREPPNERRGVVSGARDRCLADARERRKLPALQVQHLTLAPGQTVERGRAESARQVPGRTRKLREHRYSTCLEVAGRARALGARPAREKGRCDASGEERKRV